MKDWTYKLLPSLPKPPISLIGKIDNLYRPSLNRFSPYDENFLGIDKNSDWKKQTYEWIQPMASNKNLRHHFNDEFIKWIQENILSEFQESNSGVMFFDEPQLPHTDLTRDFVLIYNVETGGAESTLCFWQEEGEKILRERMITSERGPHLKLIDSVKGPFDCWYIMNTKILHSVEKVESLRLNLQISFDTNMPEFLLKNI
ncbi:MAG: hypothetical protein H7281_13680 [Bacteriovorax sp.]|nr:hypothetical protein [Bacteriovorax sp.]